MWIDTEADLKALYGTVGEASVLKETTSLTPEYRALIAASPFCVLATVGPEGLDATPRGDAPGFVDVLDERTLVMPDRRGNNRIDSLRNVVRDPRVGLLFLVPGVNETLRLNGTARISADPALLGRYAVDGKIPVTALVITITEVFFQCARALHRSALWDAARHRSRRELPSAGDMLKGASAGQAGGAEYDNGLEERHKQTLY
ncbi:pyridoxamine 5'-phosphate oxidase family protein [Phreatobacter aquaticus]|uniref:Pyridoxamine 5'-phosphate oxidase family protein n=1 Tax=Phreatobacter aquaticus TaxID=2570229 RepID=A0A4D7QTC8_9HYPH|nr:pyridoxamine 5'-phosphate oxidase family protein [Phreatobacter aquaticus]QCK87272.1 pyridoxamine 5'-phosphate oxidase family protein [Phreatobacter aquaticus]